MTSAKVQVIKEVKQILAEVLRLGDRADNFTAETPMLGSIAELDSMAVVAMLTLIEEKYDVVIEDDEINADVFETVGTFSTFLEEKLST